MNAERASLPSFTLECAAGKARLAEEGWSSRDTEKLVIACTVDSDRAEPR
jgi:uncharacterized protein